ncbi:ankyrin repeat domain-containing protein 66 [Mobula birostris]|uniref:ankyrin repeat domain-containing protein 66 n=1 Tax=Mobula birostris TaxID=1983395 RepID=UPI003B27C396
MSELHEAAAAGDTDLVEQILQKGSCDPSMKDPDWGDRTPLHWAAAKGKADMVKLLITSGSRPCLRTTTGWTPAHFAAESGKLSVLKMLHSLHAPVDKADLYGDTPRRMAEIYGQGDCVKFLEVAEQESSNYRRVAEMKGILLDDTDEEWESQKESKTAEKRETVSKSIITCKLQQSKKNPYTTQVNEVPIKGKLSKINKVCKKEVQVPYPLSEIPKSKNLRNPKYF